MAMYALNRNHTHRSVNGVVSFEKGVPTWVVPALEREIVAIGAERVDGDAPEVLDPEVVQEPAPSPEQRRDDIFAAFQLISERNESKDFTGAGVPTVKAIEKIVNFDVDRNEVVDLWGEYKVLKAEADAEAQG